MSVYFCNHIDGKERAGCFTLTAFLVFCVIVSVLWLFLAVTWVGLGCEIVVFHDHTHLLFFICGFSCPFLFRNRLFWLTGCVALFIFSYSFDNETS